MNIDDLMKEMDGYNHESETFTGFFNLDDEVVEEKIMSVVDIMSDESKKSDVAMRIDSVTDSKIEAIVVAMLFSEGLVRKGLEDAEDRLPMMVAFAMAKAVMNEVITHEQGEKILKILSDLM